MFWSQVKQVVIFLFSWCWFLSFAVQAAHAWFEDNRPFLILRFPIARNQSCMLKWKSISWTSQTVPSMTLKTQEGRVPMNKLLVEMLEANSQWSFWRTRAGPEGNVFPMAISVGPGPGSWFLVTSSMGTPVSRSPGSQSWWTRFLTGPYRLESWSKFDQRFNLDPLHKKPGLPC